MTMEHKHKLIMSAQQMIVNNPPRYAEVPVQPLPQTVCTTLEHSGLPMSQPELITDIPPDFRWMTEMQLYDHYFVWNSSHLPGVSLNKFSVQNWQNTGAGRADSLAYIPWTLMPFFGCKWWNGTISFRLMAIKPPRCTGKLLIRYSFDPEGIPDGADDHDRKRRGVVKEWDLGQSEICDFDIVATNTIEARPTWIPSAYVDQTEAGAPELFVSQNLPLQEWHYGWIKIECAQIFNPGGIFPDSVRILVFRVYKNSQFYMPTDFRGSMAHFTNLEYTPETPIPK